MRLDMVTRYAWPSVGGIEIEVRTIAAALTDRHAVRVHAHRIRTEPQWLGPLDRDAGFDPFPDPVSGVVTSQLRLTPSDLAALAPTRALWRRDGANGHLATIAAEGWHAQVAGRRFAAQLRGAELVHRFGGTRMAVATVIAARRLRVPVVITPNAHPGQWDDGGASAVAYRNADLVIATCSADADVYRGLGVAPSRIEICPVPTEASTTGGGSSVRRRYGVTGPLALFLGVRRPYKGVDELLGAAYHLSLAVPAARVAFVGPGPPLTADAPGNVIDVGEVGDAERDAWLDAADVLCLPSRNESWGLAVSEAWSVGTPVVTSDIPVLRERVLDAGGGLAVPALPQALADALGGLFADPDRRRALGAAGAARFHASLSPAAVAERCEEIYARAADAASSGGGPARLLIR